MSKNIVRQYRQREIPKFDDVENFIKEFEDYGNKFFELTNLRLGLRIFDGEERVPLREWLTDHSGDYGEFSLYLVKGQDSFETLDTIVSHDTHKDKIFVGKFCLDQMRGCCGIAIMFHMMIDFDLQGNKFGQYLVKFIKILAREKDFTELVCTDVRANYPQRAILDKFGFKKYFVFKNNKTKNLVELRSTNLNDEKYYDVIWKKKSLISQKFIRLRRSLSKIFTTTSIKKYYLKDILDKVST